MLSVNSVRPYSQNNSLKSSKTQVFKGGFDLEAKALQEATSKALRTVQIENAVRNLVDNTAPGHPELRSVWMNGLDKLFNELPYSGTPLEISQKVHQVLRDMKKGK